MKIRIGLRRLCFFLLRPINYLILSFNRVKHGRFIIYGIIYLNNNGKIIIGNNVSINSTRLISAIGGDTRTVISVAKNAVLEIGDDSGINNSAIFCRNAIKIGKNVIIGGSCKIWDTDFHPTDPGLRLVAKNTNAKTAPIIINDNVFIGGSCIILKGVEIGKNSVVGAGSVVAKNIPSNQIWAGNPARFIRNI